MRIADLAPRRALMVVLLVAAAAALAWCRSPFREARPKPPAASSEPAPPEAPASSVSPLSFPRLRPERPLPEPDVWRLLDACLRSPTRWWTATVTVEDVRRYVEVEHDPVWLEANAWWLPLSGEGDPDYPSGLYISVPLDGSACGGAIVN
jgi:hypothetical protein